jgi:hypothetical protein
VRYDMHGPDEIEFGLASGRQCVWVSCSSPRDNLGELTTNDKTGLEMAATLMSKSCLESTPLQFESFARQLPRC